MRNERRPLATPFGDENWVFVTPHEVDGDFQGIDCCEILLLIGSIARNHVVKGDAHRETVGTSVPLATKPRKRSVVCTLNIAGFTFVHGGLTL